METPAVEAAFFISEEANAPAPEDGGVGKAGSKMRSKRRADRTRTNVTTFSGASSRARRTDQVVSLILVTYWEITNHHLGILGRKHRRLYRRASGTVD